MSERNQTTFRRFSEHGNMKRIARIANSMNAMKSNFQRMYHHESTIRKAKKRMCM